MKSLITNIYRKYRTDRKSDLEKLLAKTVRKELLKYFIEESYQKNGAGFLNSNHRKKRIIVSLTSFGSRVGSSHIPIECMARQTVKPDEIILWLSEKHFNDNNIPEAISRLKSNGLRVKYRKDVGPHTKLYYAIQEYPDDIIITIDDDHVYPNDLIENLYKAHINNPNVICCNAAKRIPETDAKFIEPYYKWERVFKKQVRSKSLMPLGVNGVLYVPGCFDKDVLNLDLIKKLSPRADDIWFKMMHYRNDIDCMVTGAYPNMGWHFIALESAHVDALYVENVDKDMNVDQIKKVIEHYGMKMH